VNELRDMLEARLRHKRRLVVRAAQHADEASHLRQRRTTSLLDAEQRLSLAFLVLTQQTADTRGLHRHDAHGMADDVVQLARDARTLLSDRGERPQLALLLGALRPLARLRRLVLTQAG